MTSLDLDKTPFVAPSPNKIFGTVDSAVDFLEAIDANKALKRKLSGLQRGPFHFYRDNFIAGRKTITSFL